MHLYRPFRILLTCALILGAPLTASAQDEEGASSMNRGMSGGMGMMGHGSGMMGGSGMNGQRATGPNQAPDGQDSLSQQQRQKIQHIRQQTRQENRQIDNKIRSKQSQLQSLMQQSSPDANKVGKTYDAIDRLRRQRHDNDIAAQKRINAILTGGDSTQATSSEQPAHKTASESPSMQMGMTVDRSFCARCHAVPSPMQHTADQWPLVVDRMKRYMYLRGMRMPDAKQTAALLEYLQAGAYPGNQANQ